MVLGEEAEVYKGVKSMWGNRKRRRIATVQKPCLYI
jgi:hypothetical protein